MDLGKLHPDPEVARQHRAVVDLLTPVVKAWATDIGIDVANTGIQVHGGMGYIEESGAPQHLRDARIAAIYEGTNEIQAIDLVGRKVARDNGTSMTAFIATIRGLDAELAQVPGDTVAAIRDRLRRGVQDMADATDWLLENYADEPRRVTAGATLYLRLVGIVAGGWLMAKSAAAAERLLASGDGDPEYLRAKLVTGRFFADNYLAQSGALREMFVNGWAAIDAVDPEHTFQDPTGL